MSVPKNSKEAFDPCKISQVLSDITQGNWAHLIRGLVKGLPAIVLDEAVWFWL
jgi:hypothetical protein